MRKKIFLFLFATLVLDNFHLADAQPSRKVVRIGYLANRPPHSGLDTNRKDFLDELRKLGWIESQNIAVEQRYWENQVDRLVAQSAELVRLKVDILVTSTGTAAQAAKRATNVIPIVMVSSADAVRQGLATSLARPGGNVTGLTTASPWVIGKRLELMKEAFPKVSHVAVVGCGGLRPGDPIGRFSGTRQWNEVQDAARLQKIELLPVSLRGLGEIEGALGVIMRERVDALFVTDCTTVPAGDFIELAVKSRLPATYPFSLFVTKGGLMSYGADERASYRRAAHFVDKILNGANPAELPVEQPTEFEFVINLKTAKQIGVTIPPEVLMWANKVIK